MAFPILPLAGQTALVTGASRRLGRAIALALARAGADIVIHYRRSAPQARAAAGQVRALGRKAWLIQADLSRPAQAPALYARARRLAGPVHILVNNASIFQKTALSQLNPRNLAAHVQVNAMAPFQLARAHAQARGACVINLLDSRITDYDRDHVSYHLSKRLLHSLTRIMALEYAPRTRVNAVAPGLILPPAGEGEAYLRRLAHTNPLRRHGEAEDVARAVLFLAASPFITGQVVYVDGGRNLKGDVHG